MKYFFNISDYPDVKAIADEIIQDFDKLVIAARSMNYIPWPEPIYDGKWTVSSFKYKDEFIAERFGGAEIAKQLNWLTNPRIQTAGFSMLAPGTVIVPHAGEAGDIWRLHLGIDVTPGDCALRIGGEVMQWKEREFMMFLDEDVHDAWNFSEGYRLVMLFDIKRDAID